ncbi:unnamed protein product [Calicophoron daubneyi]|uniref:acid phosphatase n=1 Tax=Calicophoron daubneyi TaxID=300641 RepID=A0AAV2SY31_CALDB
MDIRARRFAYILCVIATFIRCQGTQRPISLQQIYVVFRHGDRTPTTYDILKTEKSFDELWPLGTGQLSLKGSLQAFELGDWIRNKYGNVVKRSYNASDVYILSSTKDRTLMTAEAFLAGLYKEDSSCLDRPGLKWRPIPVHEEERDNPLLQKTKNCARLDKLQSKQLNSNESLEYEKRHKEMFHRVQQFVRVHADRKTIRKISDSLACMQAHDMVLPKGCTDELVKEIHEVRNFYFNEKVVGTSEIVRLKVGPLVNEIFNRIQLSTQRTGSCRLADPGCRAVFYSAHDTNVAALLSAFGAFKRKRVEYAAAVILELWGPDPPGDLSEYQIKLRYKRGWTDQYGNYTQIGCCAGDPPTKGCPLHTVLEYIKPMRINKHDFKLECSVNSLPTVSIPMFTTLSLLVFQNMIIQLN